MVKEKYWKKKIKSVLSDYRRIECTRLKKYSKLVEDSKAVDMGDSNLLDKLVARGFKDEGFGWVNKEEDVVFKYNGLSEEGKTKYAIPTINLGDILIQPIARVRQFKGLDEIDKKNEQAYEILKRITVDERLDLHDDNVGWWRGVPVMVDW